MTSSDTQNPRILIVADNASMRFGGEAALPLHYFRVLRKRGVDVWMVVHERTRRELADFFPEDFDRIIFVPETLVDTLAYKCGLWLPDALAYVTFGLLRRLFTQNKQRRLVRRAMREFQINIVHQPTPVSPKEPSTLALLGVPVVIGPMNGGIVYPPAFEYIQKSFVKTMLATGRATANLMNRIIPGKRYATTLLVANERTRLALPGEVKGRTVELVENGVDMSIWYIPERDYVEPTPDRPMRFVFVGRLVDWKAVDLLLEAMTIVTREVPAELEIIGKGPELDSLRKQAIQLGLRGRGQVQFTGWLTQPACADRLAAADCMVLPSMLECGGAVILEAMAMQLPAIATNWGGPADYITEACGILVDPTSRESFIQNLAQAMIHLAKSPDLRRKMGLAGRKRVCEMYDWEIKAGQIMEIYAEAIERFNREQQNRN